MNSMEITQIGRELLKSQQFIVQLRRVLLPSTQNQKQKPQRRFITQTKIDSVISQLSSLLNDLIKQKLEQQMAQIIQDNNRILQQIQQVMVKKQSQRFSNNDIKPLQQHSMMDEIILTEDSEDGFSDIHKLINQEKRRAMGEFNDQALERSISAMVQFKCESLQQKASNMQKKIKALEDKFQTNMKSVWNVISMTEAVVFDYFKSQKIYRKDGKQNKTNGINLVEQKRDSNSIKNTKQESSFFRSLWK